jgi:hypothetical protein
MRRTALALAALAFVVLSAHAFAPSQHTARAQPRAAQPLTRNGLQGATPGGSGMDTPSRSGTGRAAHEKRPLREQSPAITPEPGAMALTSLGLIALGVAVRQRRH